MSSNDPEQIRAEIERTRQNLSDDVNALTYEAKPSTITIILSVSARVMMWSPLVL